MTNPPCLVMEYCAKCSLDHLLRAGLANGQVSLSACVPPWVPALRPSLLLGIKEPGCPVLGALSCPPPALPG